MRTFSSCSIIWSIMLLGLISQSVFTQINTKLQNPLSNITVTSAQPKLYPFVVKAQNDILSLNKAIVSQVINVTTTGFVAPTNIPSDAITQVINIFTYMLNTTEINFYNMTYLTSKVSPYHMAIFNLYTANFNQAVAALNNLNVTINNDESGPMQNINSLTNNLPSYLTNFNITVQAAAPVLQSLASLTSGYASNANLFIGVQNATALKFQQNFIATKSYSLSTSGQIWNNMSAIINGNFLAINQTNALYQSFMKNYTTHGSSTVNIFNNSYNLTCLPHEQILNQTLATLTSFSAYTQVLASENYNMTLTTVNNAISNFVSFAGNSQSKYVNYTAQAIKLLSTQSTGINTFWANFQATNTKINSLLANIAAFINAENNYVNVKNTFYWGIPVLAPNNQFAAQSALLFSNIAAVVDGPNNSGTVNIPFNMTTFSVISTSTAATYNLQNFDSAGQPPVYPTPGPTPSGVPAPAIPTIAYAVPVSFSNVGANVYALPAYSAISAWPLPFTMIGCYDPIQAAVNFYPASFAVSGNWVEFGIDISNFFYSSNPSTLVNVVATSMPGSPSVLSVPLNAASNVPNPNAVTTAPVPPSITTPSNGAVVPPVTNGWGNFVMAWRVISGTQFIRLQLLVTDLNIAAAAGLQASVTFISP